MSAEFLNSLTKVAGPSCPGCSSAQISRPANAGQLIQRRGAKWVPNLFKGWGSSTNASRQTDPDPNSPAGKDLNDPAQRQEFLDNFWQKDIKGHILEDEIDMDASKDAEMSGGNAMTTAPTKESLAFKTDPDPRARVLYQRKRVIQMVRRNGQLNRQERIKMSERELLHKSEFMATSLKKLVMLSRQIAGKNVNDAITQMRWSKKKMAAEVCYYLEEARDTAIAHRGMGLGRVNGETFNKPKKIQTKEGKWLEVTDPTSMYIAQSWVGRGPWRKKELEYKGRGHTGLKKSPATSTLSGSSHDSFLDSQS